MGGGSFLTNKAHTHTSARITPDWKRGEHFEKGTRARLSLDLGTRPSFTINRPAANGAER